MTENNKNMIKEKMPDGRLVRIMSEEHKIIEMIISYTKIMGFSYDTNTIKNFYLSLKTKPFVILTGISGTGKTKLAQLFVEAIYGKEKDSYFKMIPVQPDWNAPRFLLGFYNPLTEKYETKPFLDILLSALTDEKHAYFVCLDEMNLARVEYYFSTFLSALESGEKIELHSEKDEKGDDTEKDGVPAKIEVPNNLYFIGTVNVDETTHQFSPKVLDRANVIEFTEVDLKMMFENLRTNAGDGNGGAEENNNNDTVNQKNNMSEDNKAARIDKDKFSLEFMSDKEGKGWNNWLKKEGESIIYKYLDPINVILAKSNLHFGYRVCREILEYMFWAEEFIEQKNEPDEKKDAFTKTAAMDMQVTQKILPKIKGGQDIDRKENGTLKKLEDFVGGKKLSNSAKRVGEMRKQLKDEGYTDFWKR